MDARLMAESYAFFRNLQNMAAFLGENSAMVGGGVGGHLPNYSTVEVKSPTESTPTTSNGADSKSSADDSGPKPACRFCGKTFAQASYIKAHERLHTGEKPYVCSVCSKPFSDASNWKKHERMHSRQVPSCYEDGSISSEGGPLTPVLPPLSTIALPPPSPTQLTPALVTPTIPIVSVSSVSSVPPLPASPGSPTSVKRLKLDQSSLMCRICGKVFSTPASLSMHKKIHSGERPHTCSTCGKSFTQIGTLRAHERVHTGEKPYECKFCGRTFAQCGSYRMHERRHRRDLLESSWHRCFLCSATFSTADDLQKHMINHATYSIPQSPLNFSTTHTTLMRYPSLTEAGEKKPDIDAELSDNGEDESSPEFDNYTLASPPKELSPPADHQVAAGPAFPTMLVSSGPSPPVLSPQGNALLSMNTVFSSSVSNAIETQVVTTSQSSNVNGALDLGMSVAAVNMTKQNGDMQPRQGEGVEEVSTTTRSRKYSSDSHASLSTPDTHTDPVSSRSIDKLEEETDCMDRSRKTPSEDSSFTESRSPNEDFRNEERLTIERQNLNRRLISSSSSNSRKQKHPMRRLSISRHVDPDTSQPSFIIPVTQQDNPSLNSDELGSDHSQELLDDQCQIYKCEHCRIIFEDCTLYLLHNGFHSNDNDPFKCVICRKSCRDRIEFNCHLTSHIN